MTNIRNNVIQTLQDLGDTHGLSRRSAPTRALLHGVGNAELAALTLADAVDPVLQKLDQTGRKARSRAARAGLSADSAFGKALGSSTRDVMERAQLGGLAPKSTVLSTAADLPLIPAAVAAAMLPGVGTFAAREGHTVDKMLGTSAADFTDADAFGRLENAYELGSTPMTDTFNAFQKLSSREKTAGPMSSVGRIGGDLFGDVAQMLFANKRAPGAASDITDAVRDLAQRRNPGSSFFHGAAPTPENVRALQGIDDEAAAALGATRSATNPMQWIDAAGQDATQAVRTEADGLMWNRGASGDLGGIAPDALQGINKALDEAASSLGGGRNTQDISRFTAAAPGDKGNTLMRGAAGAGLLLGGGMMLDTGEAALLDPLANDMRKQMFGLGDRVNADETFAKKFLEQSGKNTADMVHELVTDAGRAGYESVAEIPRQQGRDALFTQVMAGDPMLSSASPDERGMLYDAHQSMARFGPSIAEDRFALQNFLRESLTSANGPDYGTAANLARAERDITGAR